MPSLRKPGSDSGGLSGTGRDEPEQVKQPTPAPLSAAVPTDSLPVRSVPSEGSALPLQIPDTAYVVDSPIPPDDVVGKRSRDEGPDSDTVGPFSCPFRKRNPIRFNVRIYKGCATQAFPDIPQLK
jgi:hypothetical protein